MHNPVATIKEHIHNHGHTHVPAHVAAIKRQSEKTFHAVTHASTSSAPPNDEDNLSLAERAQAEDAELRNQFHLADSELQPELLLIGQDHIDDFACALRKKYVTLHGRLYLFSSAVAFHSSMPFNHQKNRVLPFKDIIKIEKRRYNERSNAIEVIWSNGGEVRVELFTSFPLRNEAHRRLLSVWRRARGLGGSEEHTGSEEVEQDAIEPQVDVEDGDDVQEAGLEGGAEWVVKSDPPPPIAPAASSIWRGELKASVRGFAELVLANESAFFQGYHEQRGDKDIYVTEWQPVPVIGQVRELRYITPVQARIGPPQTAVHETHRCCVYESGRHLVLEISTVALDVPYGDHFSVECRFDATALQGDWNSEVGRCLVEVSMETKFSKRTMWHKAIESGSKSANEKGMQYLMHMAEQAVAKRSTPSVPSSAQHTIGGSLEGRAEEKAAVQGYDENDGSGGDPSQIPQPIGISSFQTWRVPLRSKHTHSSISFVKEGSGLSANVLSKHPEFRAKMEAAQVNRPGVSLSQQEMDGMTSGGEDLWAQLVAPCLGGVPILILALMAIMFLQFLLSLR